MAFIIAGSAIADSFLLPSNDETSPPDCAANTKKERHALEAACVRRHRRGRPVVRDVASDRVAWTAVRAVREGIAVAAVGRVEDLAEAVRTSVVIGGGSLDEAVR